MSRAELDEVLGTLYDVVEVNNMGAVPAQVAAETVKLVNPALSSEHAGALVIECDSRGKQLLLRSDLVKACEMALSSTEIGDAIRVVKDLIVRMRVSLRRRYLMYDAAANTPPPSLLENQRAVAIFRQIFDTEANGAEYVNRAQLKSLANATLPEYKADANNVCKAALGDPERDLVGFFEFLMVLQPATSKRPLTEMLRLAKESKMSGAQMHSHSMGRAQSMMSTTTARDVSIAPSVAGGAVGARPKAAAIPSTGGSQAPSQQGSSSTPVKSSMANIQYELERYRYVDETAERKVAEILQTQTPLPVPASLSVAQNSPQRSKNNMYEREGSVDREVARLRLENEELQHQLTAAMHNASMSAAADRSKSAATIAAQFPHGAVDEGVVHEMEAKIELLERELKLTRAQLAVAQEGTQLIQLLKSNTNGPHAALKDFYPDESSLIAKHDYLRGISDVFHENPDAPVATVMSQYDLLVVSYQAMYRKLRDKYEASKRKSFNQMEAAANIIPRNTVLSPQSSFRAASNSTSSMSRAAQPRSSPMRRHSSPMKWSDLDREPTEDMRGTGTLADPLLTLEERNTLRAKLAAQMRGSARHYKPATTGSPMKQRRSTSTSSSVASHNGSQATMARLSSMAGTASRVGRLA